MMMDIRRRHSSGSTISTFDAKPLRLDTNLNLISDQNINQSPSQNSRLPSFQHKPNRQKLSLTTRKCLSSNVTPISSPVIPRNINNNYNQPTPQFSKEVIESSAKLINDIDVTLSQLSRQYHSNNNNSFESPFKIQDENQVSSVKNNNVTIMTQDSCDYRVSNKMQSRKKVYPNNNIQEVDKYKSLPKTSIKLSNIPNPSKCSNDRQKSNQVIDQGISKSLKLPKNESSAQLDSSYSISNQNYGKKHIKSSTKRSKSSNIITKGQEKSPNLNPSYTETWVYNSRLDIDSDKHSSDTKDLLNYIFEANTESKPISPSNQTYSKSNVSQKSIFSQHHHNSTNICKSPQISPIIPLCSRRPKNDQNEFLDSRDSGIFSSTGSKESSAESPSEVNVQNIQIMSMSFPQPPPRISSLVLDSHSDFTNLSILSNQTSILPNKSTIQTEKSLKQVTKDVRRKTRELFTSVKQRDELKNSTSSINEAKLQSQDGDQCTQDHICKEISPMAILNNDVLKVDIRTPNSEMDSATVEGYCSDMDTLKHSGYYSDSSVYMDESGFGIYAQKMQQRFREGLLAVEESLQMVKPNKISTNKVCSLDKDDISLINSEEIEDYIKHLNSRLVSPEQRDDMTKSNDSFTLKKCSIPRSKGSESLAFQVKQKNKIYEERLEKYACDVESAADFDITSSCSMDLLTGKIMSDIGSEDEVTNYKSHKMDEEKRICEQNVKISSNEYYTHSGTKSSVNGGIKENQRQSNKSRTGTCSIQEGAGPTPALFEDDNNGLKFIDEQKNHYLAMSLPVRPRRGSGWLGESKSLLREEVGYALPMLPQSDDKSNVYYDLPAYSKSTCYKNGTSLMNVRLPYPTNNQRVKNSTSATSLGKRDTDTEDIYDGMGSHLSLLSSSSYRSLNEERHAAEIRKLRRELEVAQQKVRTLSGQLFNNGTLVAAFENTLQSMSMRLQKFAANSESKECELNELKSTVESLKKQAGSSNVHNDPNQSNPKIYTSTSLTSLISNSNSNDKRSDSSMKKSSWFKVSLGRAFRKKSTKENGSSESVNEINNNGSTGTQSTDQTIMESENLQSLRKELEEKDARLTDVQLDALSRSHQLEQLRDLLTKMRYEMSSLKADNSRLQSLMTVSNEEPTSDPSILNDSNQYNRQNITIKSIPRFKDINTRPKFDFLNALVKEVEGSQSLTVFIILKKVSKFTPSHVLPQADDVTSTPIGRVGISSMTSWSDLENNLRRLLKEYVTVIDPLTNLGLNGESISRYRINTDTSISLCNPGGMRPLTSPLAACENVVESKIYLELKNYGNGNSIDEMVLEFLIPKPILLRYLNLLLEHKRIILSGPSGTGKSYLANKLALNMAGRYNRDPSTSILIFNLDHKSTKELRSYMTTLTEQLLKMDPHPDPCISSNTPCLPLVIILDNLHHVSSFSEIFNSFLSIHHSRSPFIIGTMNQSNTVTSNHLQLHHNFRWVLCTNHMEPVKGFLGRYLRRQFLKHQMESKQNLDQLYHVIEWISVVWQHINKFLETYSSAEVTIGPRLFLNCPMEVEKSKAWFLDLWNYSLVPYVLDAVRDGLNTHGRKQATWDDPTDWIIRSWPWSDPCNPSLSTNVSLDTCNLIRLRPEDVGFDSYQLNTKTSSNIGPYTVSSHFPMDSLNANSGRHSAMLERRPKITEKSDNNNSHTGMFQNMQKPNNRKS